jgi:glycolate oxidase iron-sulfur subunit
MSAARVLEEIPEIEYLPTTDSTACCGGGGTFFYEYPEVSAKMGRSKINNARKTGAKIWLTDCPVCRLNLSGQLSDDDTITMMHPAKYLAMLFDL